MTPLSGGRRIAKIVPASPAEGNLPSAARRFLVVLATPVG